MTRAYCPIALGSMDKVPGVGSALWPQPSSDHRLQSEIHSLAKWTHAVTVTFVRADRYGRPCTQHVMSSAVRHFLRVLSIKCFGRKRFDKGFRVPAAGAFGMGPSDSHPHCHLVFAAPEGMDFFGFRKLIHTAVRKTRWFDQQFRVERYYSDGWIKYLLDHQEELFFDLPRPAHPSIG